MGPARSPGAVKVSVCHAEGGDNMQHVVENGVVRTVCPHDCPDARAVLVTVYRTGASSTR